MEDALLVPFVLWFVEALAGLVVWVSLVRTYWLPIAYVLPIHIRVVIAMILFIITGIIEAAKKLEIKK